MKSWKWYTRSLAWILTVSVGVTSLPVNALAAPGGFTAAAAEESDVVTEMFDTLSELSSGEAETLEREEISPVLLQPEVADESGADGAAVGEVPVGEAPVVDVGIDTGNAGVQSETIPDEGAEESTLPGLDAGEIPGSEDTAADSEAGGAPDSESAEDGFKADGENAENAENAVDLFTDGEAAGGEESLLESGETRESSQVSFTYSIVTDADGNQGAKITGCNNDGDGTGIDLVIPDSLDGYPVWEIGERALTNSTWFSSVTIPGSVAKIGFHAFGRCTSLETVVLSEGLTTIDGSAFSYCSSLISVNIPETVVKIGASAFASCGVLKKIELPDSVTSIGDSAFQQCGFLETVVLPEGLTSIGNYLFGQCSSLTSIQVPNGVTSIGTSAFRECQALTSVTLPETLMKIGKSAFASCSALKNITLPDSVTTISDSAFEKCGSLETVDWPTGLISIGSYAFVECDVLTSGQLPEGLTGLGESAFQFCQALTSVRIPETLSRIGNGAFYGCKNLRELSLPENLKGIGSQAFMWCTSLEGELRLPETLTELGTKAFMNCSSITSLVLPEGMTVVPYQSFSGCTNLTELHFPSTLTEIGTQAFEKCEALTQISFPNSLQKIGVSAFSKCISLTNLVLPESVADIGNNAFEYCRLLVEAVWPSGCTKMPDSVFMNCNSLAEISLPAGLTEIGYYAFYGCTGLSQLRVPATVTAINKQAFYGVPKDKITLLVFENSFAHKYAEDNGFSYLCIKASESLSVETEGVANWEAYRGCRLTVACGESTVHCAVTEKTSYRFTNLPVGESCTVTLSSARGEILGSVSGFVIGNGENKAVLSDVLPISRMELALFDEDAQEVTEHGTVQWLRPDGSLYGDGAVLSGVPAGTELTCVVRLNRELGVQYQTPETFVWTADGTDAKKAVLLKPLEKRTVTGRLLDEKGVPVKGASVTAVQKINESYESSYVARTDAQGAFCLEVTSGEAELTCAAYGYTDRKESLEAGTENQDLGELILSPLTGAKLTLKAEYYAAAKGEPRKQSLLTLEDLKFTGTNETSGEPLGNMILQERTLMIPEGVHPGDRLKLQASSISGDFAPVEATVELGEALSAAAEFRLVQRGGIEVSCAETENESLRMLVYDFAGKLAGETAFSQTEAGQAEGLPSGEYTVVLMGESEVLQTPSEAAGLDAAGFVENQDYVMAGVTVEDGVIIESAFETVPRLEEARFLYTDPAKTYFSANKTKVSAGSYYTLRAEAGWKEEAADRISDPAWIFEFPENTSYVPDTLTCGNQFCTSMELGESRIRVPVQNTSELLRFCLVTSEAETARIDCSLEFTLDGRRICQPVGNTQVQVDEATFEICEYTHSTKVPISGTAAPHSWIQVYDNEVLVARKKANAAGAWSSEFELYKPYKYSAHSIYLEITPSTGQTVRTASRNVTYRYSGADVYSKRVSMIYEGKEITLNYTGLRNGAIPYVYHHDKPDFSFLAEFEGEDLEAISAVSFEVLCNNGETRKLTAARRKNSNVWSAFGKFYLSAVPVQVNVRYNIHSEPMVSREEISDLKEAWDAAEAEMNEAQKELEVCERVSREDVIFDTEAILREAQALVEEGSLPAEELSELKLQLKQVENIGELYDSVEGSRQTLIGGLTGFIEETQQQTGIEETENGYAIQNGSEVVETQYLTCDSLTPEELLKDGYKEYASTSGTPVYAKMDEKIGMVSYADFETNLFVKSVPTQEARMRLARSGGADILEMGRRILDGVEDFKDKWDLVLTSLQEYLDSCERATALIDKELADIQKLQNFCRLRENHWSGNYGSTQAAFYKLQYEECVQKCENLEKQRRLIQVEGRLGKSVMLGLKALGITMTIASIVRWASEFDNLYKIYVKCDNGGHHARATGLATRLSIYLGKEITMLWLDVSARLSKFVGAISGGGILVGLVIDLGITLVNGVVDDLFEQGFYTDLYNLRDDCQVCKCEKCKGKMDDNYRLPYSGSGNRYDPIIDPSGYVYEAVASNRLEGVTATAYRKVYEEDIYGDIQEKTEVWDAEDYGQRNPLLTDREGKYAWDVPEGSWQVKYEKNGYETAFSRWLDVPPPHFDVNVGLVSYERPELARVEAYPDGIELTFSKYMRAENLEGCIGVMQDGAELPGRLELMNGEANPENEQEIFVSRVRFVPQEPLAVGSVCTVIVEEAARSYANVPLERIEREQKVVSRVESFRASASVELPYDGTGEIRLEAQPASAAAGKKVRITNQSALLFAVAEETVTLDEKGTAFVHVEGLLPGQGTIAFALEGTSLTAETSVALSIPEPEPAVGQLILSGKKTMTEGEKATFKVQVLPQEAAQTQLVWSSSSPEVASVSQSGLVTAKKKGKTVITVATTDGTKSAALELTVNAKIISVTGIRLNKKNVTMKKKGAAYTLKATVTPSNATNKKVTWKSSDSKVAAVNAAGKVTAKGYGKAVITARTVDRGKSAACTVTVQPPAIKGVKATGASKAFTAKWKKLSGISGYEIEYSTNKKFKKNVKRAKVKSWKTTKKKVKGLKKGTYYIRMRAYVKKGKTVTYGAYSGTVKTVVKK